MSADTRAAALVVVFALPTALVAGIVAGVFAGWAAGIGAAAGVAMILASWARFGGDIAVRRSVGGRRPDPIGEARLLNLVEGLCAGVGLPPPDLRVVDTPALNALAAGTSASRALVAVTSGLLADITRLELEAVLALQLVRIRQRATLPETVLVATGGLGRRIGLASDREQAADLAAVALTRYPPALASALEKIDAKGSALGGRRLRSAAHLWLADPDPASGPSGTGGRSTTGRLDLRGRAEALKEL